MKVHVRCRSHLGVALALIVFSATGVSALPLSRIAPPTGGDIVRVDSRLYRHCHIVGSRGFTKCMTAEPWSPEHMELDRRAGLLDHEGGPLDAARKLRHLPPLDNPFGKQP